MCGINGIIGFGSEHDARKRVQLMNNCLAHRGPDAEGLWSNHFAALGHRRLSIIDTSTAGNQPFFSDDKKLVIVFNGEIYNYIELKKELESEFEFKTQCDTEVMLAAYQKWGIACIEHFLGMFAFALWDENEQAMYLVRDRLGIKPLYYSDTPKGFVFSSEVRGVLQSELVERKLDERALTDYLRYQTVHAPRTIIRDVQMLMPGHYMRITRNEKSIHEYWNASDKAREDISSKTKKEIHSDIFSLLQSSVEIRMRADVPFGAFLSGGIDSSAVVGLMSRITNHPVKTFSVTFFEKEFDESPWSAQVAKKFNTDHTEIKLSAKNFLELVPEALQHMDHPSGDGPNTYVISKVTRAAGVKMALSGLGGDELFAGYDVFKRMKSLEHKKWLNIAPKFFRELSGRALSKLNPSIATEKIAETLEQKKIDFAHVYPLTRKIFSDDIIGDLLSSEVSDENPVARIAKAIALSDLPLLSQVSVAEISTYMQNVLLRDTDQMSMAHSLEVRVPFLDHRLVEYVLGVSDEMKYPHSPKKLLVDSLGDLLPPEIIDRPKMGFTFPWAHWMKNELKGFCETHLASLASTQYFKPGSIEKLWQRFMNNDPLITWSRIWPLVVLGCWMKENDVN